MPVAVWWQQLKYQQMEEQPGDRLILMSLIKVSPGPIPGFRLAEGNTTIKARGIDDSGNIEIPGEEINVTIGPDVCPCNIFPPASLPIKPLDNDLQGIEIGVRFQATEDGFISGIRYFKGTGTTGTHVGSLWTNAGVSLATATFTNETESGWQEVLFSSPVAITAGVTYVASTFSPSGDYASTKSYFTQAVVNGPLRGLADGEDGSNGVFSYGTAPTFPTTSVNSTNYWVDVVYTKTNGGTAPAITKQPVAVSLCAGLTASFTSEAGGSPSPTVQWQSSIRWNKLDRYYRRYQHYLEFCGGQLLITIN